MEKQTETPDAWIVIKIDDGKSVWHKLFVSWNGGYLSGDSWRMNSGITRIEEDGNDYLIFGFSGSCYRCNKNTYGKLNSYTHGILANVIENSQRISLKAEDLSFEEFKQLKSSI